MTVPREPLVLRESDLRGFMKNEVRPHLPHDYVVYMKRDYLRMRGPFVQLLTVSLGRGGRVVKVHPTFYVAGADLEMEVITESASLGMIDPLDWRFVDQPLDSSFAQLIIDRVAARTPLSFTEPIADGSMAGALRSFAQLPKNWSVRLLYGFLLILLGKPEARRELVRALADFTKDRRKRTDFPVAWELELDARFTELIARLDARDCIIRCRQDAEAHATRLKLPAVRWPEEWPLG